MISAYRVLYAVQILKPFEAKLWCLWFLGHKFTKVEKIVHTYKADAWQFGNLEKEIWFG